MKKYTIMHKQYTHLQDVQERIYEGYIWASDDEYPTVIRGKKYKFNDSGNSPYILEAMLYSRQDDVAVIVRYAGEYSIHEFDLKNIPAEDLKAIEYLPHRLEGVSKVCFKQLWLPENDENCEGWPVLKMKALIFTGFDNNKKS